MNRTMRGKLRQIVREGYDVANTLLEMDGSSVTKELYKGISEHIKREYRSPMSMNRLAKIVDSRVLTSIAKAIVKCFAFISRRTSIAAVEQKMDPIIRKHRVTLVAFLSGQDVVLPPLLLDMACGMPAEDKIGRQHV